MADSKISELTSSTAQSTDLIPVARSGDNYAITVDSVADILRTELTNVGNAFENIGATRDFLNALNTLSNSEEGVITIASYGDSVSPEVAITFTDQLAREHIGNVGTSSWSDTRLNNAWELPNSVESTGRWPGSGGASYVLGGSATYVSQPDGSTPDPTYVPNKDQHWVIPSGSSVTWTIGLAGSNFQRCMAFLVKEPGAGDATVELLNAATDAVITTTVVGSLANGSLDATHVEFNSLDMALGYKIKVSCTSGTIRALGVVGLKRRCILPLYFTWGGSYLQQQNRSSTAIFNYICNTLNPAIWFVETRGETPTEFTGAGIGGDATSGITNLCTRLNAVPGSKVFIGGKPTTNVVNDDAQTALYREAARTNGYVFIDGVALLKDNATLVALQWNKKNGVTDNVHLNFLASAHISSLFFDQLPIAHVRNVWNCRDVYNSKVMSVSYRVRYVTRPDDVSGTIEFAKSSNAATHRGVDLTNVINLTLLNSSSAATGTFSMFGNVIRPSVGLDLPSGAAYALNGTHLLRGQVSGWSVPTGTLTRSTFATYAGQTISNPPTQAEVQAIDNHVKILSERLAALIRDLHNTSATNVRLLA